MHALLYPLDDDDASFILLFSFSFFTLKRFDSSHVTIIM